MKLNNTVFMTVPIFFDYEELELNTDEQKQAFIDIFLKEVVHIPLVQKIYFDEDDVQEKVIGVIAEAKQTEDYHVNLFVMSFAEINVEYSRVPTTLENATDPLGMKLNVSSIVLDIKEKTNKTTFDLTEKQREISERIKMLYEKKQNLKDE